MLDVLTEILINKPVRVVADYAAEPDNAPVWYRNIRSSQWRTPPPLAQGSRIMFTARFLGRDLEYVYEVVKFIPGSVLVMQTTEGPLRMRTTYTWQSVGRNATRMRLRNTGEASMFPRVIAPLMTAAMRRANTKDLQTLKDIMESRG